MALIKEKCLQINNVNTSKDFYDSLFGIKGVHLQKTQIFQKYKYLLTDLGKEALFENSNIAEKDKLKQIVNRFIQNGRFLKQKISSRRKRKKSNN